MIRLIQLAEKKRVDLNHWINHNPVGFPEQSLQPAPKGVIITTDHNYTRPTYPHSAVPFQSSKWLNFISVGIFYATQRKSSFHEILVTYGQTRRKHHPLSGHRYAHTKKRKSICIAECCLLPKFYWTANTLSTLPPSSWTFSKHRERDKNPLHKVSFQNYLLSLNLFMAPEWHFPGVSAGFECSSPSQSLFPFPKAFQQLMWEHYPQHTEKGDQTLTVFNIYIWKWYFCVKDMLSITFSARSK